jgi:sugar phosphate isomerase/epimerase
MSLHGLKEHWEASFFVRILEKIDPDYIIDGFEINGNPNDEYDYHYMATLCKLFKMYNRLIQFHAPFNFQQHYDDLDYLNESLSIYEEFAAILNYPITLVIHTVDSFDTEIAISRTHRFLENLTILKKINNYNIVFSIENLNNTSDHKRLNTSMLYELLERHPHINFCWDIGHEVSENNCNYYLNNTMRHSINNVHIHDIHHKDHYPFDYGKTDYERALSYLNTIQYTGSVVTEINICYLRGETLLEKFRVYTLNIKRLKDYYEANKDYSIALEASVNIQ